jgi:hypothetical protein
MKVRQAYEGRVIEARSSELKDGGAGQRKIDSGFEYKSVVEYRQ